MLTRTAIRRGDGELQVLMLKIWLPLFVYCGHYQYKWTIATFLYNFQFKWSEFWKDFILKNGSVHGKRKGHSIAFDHMNEIFVGLFKRMVRRGRPSHAVMSRISQNLSFLKENWETLNEATGGTGLHSKSKVKTAFYEEVKVCVGYFREREILSFDKRKLATLYPSMEQKKLEKLHGSVINKVITQYLKLL